MTATAAILATEILDLFITHLGTFPFYNEEIQV